MNEEDLTSLPGVERTGPDTFADFAVPAPDSEEQEEITTEELQPQTTEQPQPQQEAPAEEARPDGNAGMDNPISQFLENSQVSLRDWIDDTFQGDQQTREDIESGREQKRSDNMQASLDYEDATYDTAAGTVYAETVRGVIGGVAGVVEQPVRFAQQLTGNDASFNLGIAENKTAVGNFARTTITMLGLMKGARVVPGLGAASKSAGGRIAQEAARGAIADFIMEEGDGNLTNMLEDMNPDLKDTWLTALAHDDDDNVYIRKLKNTVEGGIFGAALDGVSELYGAIRAGKKAAKAGGSKEQVADAVTEYFDQTELDLGYAAPRPERPTMAYDVAPEVLNLDASNVSKLDGTELKKLETEYDAFAFDPDIQDEVIRNANPEAAMEAFGRNITVKELPNGTKIDWIQTDVTDELDRLTIANAPEETRRAYNKRKSELVAEAMRTNPDMDFDMDAIDEILKSEFPLEDSPFIGQKVVRIDWDSNGGELGNSGTKLYRQFGEIAKDQKPGTIIEAEAAGDGYGGKGISRAQERLGGDDPEIEAQSIREKLYMRAGLSAPGEADKMYGIIKYRPDGRRTMVPLDPTKPIQPQVDAAKELPVQATLNLGDTNAVAGPNQVRRRGNVEPGVEARLDESRANNADSVETNMWEPNERAAVTAGHTFGDTISSQIDQAVAGNPSQGGSRSFMVDETFKRILASTDQNKAISEVIRAAEEGTDVKAIIAKLRTTNDRQFAESVPILNDFLEANKNADGTTNWDALEKLVETGTGGTEKVYMTIEGGIAVRGLQVDIANQLRDIADAMRGVDEIGGDSYRQAEMLIERLRVLDRMNLNASADAGQRLQARNVSTLNVRKALEDGEIDGSVAKRIDENSKKFDELQEKLAQGDPEAKAEFATLADSMAMANGDPEKVLKFWGIWRKSAASGLKSALYNGFLSSTTSQVRNLTGNAFNLTLRPVTQAVGFLTPQIDLKNGKLIGPNITEARMQMAAYHGIMDNIQEAFKVAKMSWDSSSVDSQAVRFDDGYSAGSARQIVDQAKEMAKTDGERFAAGMVELQYNLFSHPWAKMPTRGLGAVDDAVRTLSARMELKKDAMRNSFEKGQGFKVDADRYAKLVDLKIDGNGNILDQQLLDTAKDVTFQTELQGFAKDADSLLKRSPFLVLNFPFVKTPLNIMRTTFTYVPGANRFIGEYRAAMKGNDEAAKALYRGREAMGVMTMGSAVALAATGNLTGNGPVDREKRELWEKTNQPNSIRTPWGWVSYETLEPINTIFSMAADLTQLANAGNDSLYDQGWAQAAYTISSAIVDKSYFKGLIDMAGLLNVSDPRWGRMAGMKAGGTVNTLILPYSGARAQLSKLLAPGKQEFDGWMEQTLASAIPGGRQIFGAQRVDIFTKKEMNPFDYAGHIWNTLTPFDVGSSDNNNLAGRLGELGVDVNFQFSDTFKGVKLSATERQMLNKYIAETDLGKELDRLLSKEWFQTEVEEWKEGNLSSEGTRWMKEINRKLAAAKKAAKARMLRENPTFADKVALNDRQRTLLKQGRYEKAETVQEQLQLLLDYK